MLQLTKDDIYLDQQADNKQDAIKKVASALTQREFVQEGYVDGMLERESQAATYLGSGIAIPHGTTTTRHLVKKTGVQVFYFPQGVVWGDDGEKAYIAIGIAASSDEHLTLLRQLTHVLGDEDVEDRIKQIKTKEDIIALLTGQSSQDENNALISDDLLLLDIPADNIETLQALNASKLKRVGAINANFIANSLDTKPSYIGQGVWVSDCNDGNLKNAIAISRTISNIQASGKDVKVLISMSIKSDAADRAVERLAELAYHQQLSQLHTAKDTQISQLFTSDIAISDIFAAENTQAQPTQADTAALTAEFIVLNPHGLHTRPASVLVKTVKQFDSVITVANLDGTGNAVSATSLMKIVALGAKKGCRLKFTAEGSDAQKALDTIGQAISDGLGEGTE
ncbi:phosphocarrier protein HPr /PTS system D-fructose-specific IIA component (F1P-forming) (Frc family) [Orbus hercynius]|uniref:Phosphocarrier protein HPr /PTS system D-fructose-specific IIA component (F1P-forming) (Frc family) n=1 Tax=Orbus hercynius TaxID=593135 RepID=A0A495RKX2_9GAMM|nr:fused PTS fructose transporter subunit IIA/HPr protein [Orbus hercynius]RKS87826.1 phosphocarrier protein HPr /PTS system D-fructose-specific IIA component (F1P-forming) (Frc family) [Orbus hercynius]